MDRWACSTFNYLQKIGEIQKGASGREIIEKLEQSKEKKFQKRMSSTS